MNEHSLHSPLVYDIYRKLIKPSRKAKGDQAIEKIREELLKNELSIEFVDFGTGADRPPNRKISDIAHYSLSSKKENILLSSLVEYFECEMVIELGTSLGINALYMSKYKDCELITFEGSPTAIELANRNFKRLRRSNIQVVEGDIDKTLPYFLERSGKIDLVYFDANHAYLPTIRYYDLCRQRAHDETIFVFDDIHYSREMEKAWDELRARVEVTMSIDLYSMGILLFDPSLSKQHFILEF